MATEFSIRYKARMCNAYYRTINTCVSGTCASDERVKKIAL